jgi:peptidoglycan/LPS O-acetylase OafA/YrhL
MLPVRIPVDEHGCSARRIAGPMILRDTRTDDHGHGRGTPLPTRGGGRFAALDSLRGVAALMVLGFHCWKIGLFAEPTGWTVHIWRWTPLNWLVTGRPWVILFFVLSGFVLSVALERAGEGQGYSSFVLRRMCRIYLPFAASILFSALAWFVVHPAPIEDLSNWFNRLAWTEPPAPRLVGLHLLMTGVKGQDSLNPVMWSLVYELRISVVFPFLWLAVRRWPWASLLIAVLAHAAAGLAVGCGGNPQCAPFRGDDLLESLVLTGYFAIFFVCGMLLARYRQPVTARLRSVAGGWRAALSLGAIYSVILPYAPRFSILLPADLTFGLGSALMIALALASPAWSRILQLPPLLWLGRVSYSLYLTHNVVLLAVVHLLYPRLGGAALLAVVVIASLLVSEIAFRLVEAPAIRLGRHLSRPRRVERVATGPA